MKLSKLMLSAFVAAVALVSCNKEETTPLPDRLKTVEISLENMMLTKSASESIADQTKVQVNKFKIFLTDDSKQTVYVGKNESGVEINPVFTAEQLEKSAVFHFVDPKCTRVIVVANYGDTDITLAELGKTLNIDGQQNEDNLLLYAEQPLKPADRVHNDKLGDITYEGPVYTAELTLVPRVARFEIDGFNVAFDSADPEFNEIKFTQVAFQNYYPGTTLNTGVESGDLVKHISDFNNQSVAFGWLNGTKEAKWYWDAVNAVCTPAAPVAQLDKALAYHMFANQTAPTLVLQLLADGQPAYLYSKKFMDGDGKEITEFKEGHIYRMHAGSAVAGGDGDIPVDPGAIDPVDRCLEITVEVTPWTVVLVKPEF